MRDLRKRVGTESPTYEDAPSSKALLCPFLFAHAIPRPSANSFHRGEKIDVPFSRCGDQGRVVKRTSKRSGHHAAFTDIDVDRLGRAVRAVADVRGVRPDG